MMSRHRGNPETFLNRSTNPASWLGSLGRLGWLVIRISLPSLRVLSNPLNRVMFRNKALDYFRFAIGP